MIKKKNNISQKDLKDWQTFVKDLTNISDKDQNKILSNRKEYFKWDLHGYSISDANEKAKELIDYCFEKNIKNLFLITGKGLHSKTEDNVFVSNDYSKLRYAVPNYIKNNIEIKDKVSNISVDNKIKGGEGVLVIKVKSKNKF